MAYLLPHNDLRPIRPPHQLVGVAADFDFFHTCLPPHVPETDTAIGSAARKLRLGKWVEGHILDRAGVTSQLGRIFQSRFFWVPITNVNLIPGIDTPCAIHHIRSDRSYAPHAIKVPKGFQAIVRINTDGLFRDVVSG